MNQPGYMPSSDQFPHASNPLIFKPQKKVGVRKDYMVNDKSKKQVNNNFRKKQFQQPNQYYMPENFENQRPSYDTERLVNIFDPSEELMAEHDNQLTKELCDNISQISSPKGEKSQSSKIPTPSKSLVSSAKFISQNVDQFQKIPFGALQNQQRPNSISYQQKGYQSIQQSKAKNGQKMIKPNPNGFTTLFGESHSRLKVLHPTKPLIISDHGFKLKIEDLNSFSDKTNCEEQLEKAAVYLDMPFTNKIIQIENIQLTQDGNYVMCVVKTLEIPFQQSNFHIVIYSLVLESPQANGTTFGHVCNYIIPGQQQAWNDPNSISIVDDPKLGEAIKILEMPSQLQFQHTFTRIYTVLNLRFGGFSIILWQFDFGTQCLKVIDQRLLESNITAQCKKFAVLPYVQELPSANSSYTGQGMEIAEKFKFVTEHCQDKEQKTFLHFWTYEFKLKDLFLDKAILYDCPISILHGCSFLTNFLYVQRSSFEKDILIYNQNAELIDKIDQAEEITCIKGYQDSLVMLANSNNEIVFYNLKQKKQVRKCAKLGSIKNKVIKDITLFVKDKTSDTLLAEMSDGSHVLLDLDREEIVKQTRPRVSSKIIHQEWLPIQSQKGMHNSYFIQLIDEPQPLLEKFSIIDQQWVKTHSKICQLDQITCLKVDPSGKYVFVSTKSGLLQGFNTGDLSPCTDVIALSTYQINNFDLYFHLKDLYIVVALSSGAVSIYKSIDKSVIVSNNYWKNQFTYQQTMGNVSSMLEFEFLSQLCNHFEMLNPTIQQTVRVAMFIDKSKDNLQQNMKPGSVLQQMAQSQSSVNMSIIQQPITRQERSKSPISIIETPSNFIVQCLSQFGEVLVYKIDLQNKQTQLINKLKFPNDYSDSKNETVIDHQIHAGSFQYSIVLTDVGNIHFYHIYEKPYGSSDGYRGSIQTVRGSQKIEMDSTGLYLAVIQPMFPTISYEMIGFDDRWLLENLKKEQNQRQTVVSVYEVGTGKLVDSLQENFIVGAVAWSKDGKNLSVGSRQNRHFKLYQVEKECQENIWTQIDSIKRDSKIWNKFPIDLKKNTMVEEIDRNNEQMHSLNQTTIAQELAQAPSNVYKTQEIFGTSMQVKKPEITKDGEKMLEEIKLTQTKLFASQNAKSLVFAPQASKSGSMMKSNSIQLPKEAENIDIDGEPNDTINISRNSVQQVISNFEAKDEQLNSMSRHASSPDLKPHDESQALEANKIAETSSVIQPTLMEQPLEKVTKDILITSLPKPQEKQQRPPGILKEKSTGSNAGQQDDTILSMSGSQKRRASVDFADQEVKNIMTKTDEKQDKGQADQVLKNEKADQVKNEVDAKEAKPDAVKEVDIGKLNIQTKEMVIQESQDDLDVIAGPPMNLPEQEKEKQQDQQDKEPYDPNAPKDLVAFKQPDLFVEAMVKEDIKEDPVGI